MQKVKDIYQEEKQKVQDFINGAADTVVCFGAKANSGTAVRVPRAEDIYLDVLPPLRAASPVSSSIWPLAR